MTDALLAATQQFYGQSDVSCQQAQGLVAEALQGCDDGELFLEASVTEMLTWDDGRLKAASYDQSQGYGLRAVAQERAFYAQSSAWGLASLQQSAQTVQAVRAGYSGTLAVSPNKAATPLYVPDNSAAMVPLAEKLALLQAMDAYARQKDASVRQFRASLFCQWKLIEIMHADGQRVADMRPLIRLDVSIMLAHGDQCEEGAHGVGGRAALADFTQPAQWQAYIDEAYRKAQVKLAARPTKAGEQIVVLGSGWPGVLLHEAVGHGLEGDFNRKQTSAFAGLMGQRVAAKGVTVVDDGTIAGRRGSLTFDDEGTPTSRTTLIEDGILVGFLQDRLNARLMNMPATGNGRRQSYAYMPMPRMTNTFMLSGNMAPAEIIAQVKSGIYAPSFGGGQVDITSGKFVFDMEEAYQIENGKIGAPLKGATLVGMGPEALLKISMIGNDSRLDTGVGTCGKNGQGVPVGVGQPTLCLTGMTVGGAAT